MSDVVTDASLISSVDGPLKKARRIVVKVGSAW
jgi:hypothetical protein